MSAPVARTSRSSGGGVQATRQQLDELDALLQRMLDLPVTQADEPDPAGRARTPWTGGGPPPGPEGGPATWGRLAPPGGRRGKGGKRWPKTGEEAPPGPRAGPRDRGGGARPQREPMPQAPAGMHQGP